MKNILKKEKVMKVLHIVFVCGVLMACDSAMTLLVARSDSSRFDK